MSEIDTITKSQIVLMKNQKLGIFGEPDFMEYMYTVIIFHDKVEKKTL